MEKKAFIMLVAIASIIVATTSFAQVYPEGLISCWKFDDSSGTTAIDSVGMNDGAIMGGATWTTGIVNGALSFDDIDDYVALSEISGSAYNDFTIAVWFKTDTDYSNIPPESNYNDYFYTVFGSGIGTINIMPSEPYGGSGEGGRISFLVYPCRNGWCSSPTCGSCPYGGKPHEIWQRSYVFGLSDVINKDQWYHAVITAEGNNELKAYLNGAFVGDLVDIVSGISANHNYARVGVDTFDWYGTFYNVSYYDGRIDEIAVHNRVLTPGEIQQHYQNGLKGLGCGAIAANIDIKPGSDPNSINLSSAGVIPVAILSSADFDATMVNPDTVFLAGAKVRMAGKSGKLLCHEEDVNNDALLDLVCKVVTEEFLIETGDSVAVLEAETYDGTQIRGEDSIRIVPDN